MAVMHKVSNDIQWIMDFYNYVHSYKTCLEKIFRLNDRIKKNAPKITSITRIAKAPHDAFLSRSNTESNEINARYTLSPGVELKSPAMITEGLQLNLFEMSCSN